MAGVRRASVDTKRLRILIEPKNVLVFLFTFNTDTSLKGFLGFVGMRGADGWGGGGGVCVCKFSSFMSIALNGSSPCIFGGNTYCAAFRPRTSRIVHPSQGLAPIYWGSRNPQIIETLQPYRIKNCYKQSIYKSIASDIDIHHGLTYDSRGLLFPFF